MSESPEARGYAAFVEHGLNRAGARRSKPGGLPGARFVGGWADGMTQQEATDEAQRRWMGLTDEQKNGWAYRAGAGTLAPVEVAAFKASQDPSPTPSPTPKPVSKPSASLPFVGPPRPRDAQAKVPGVTRPAPAGLSPIGVKEWNARNAAVSAAPDGSRVIGDNEAGAMQAATGRRINTITGLPFGHLPGDALPAGADAAMKERAAQSVKRAEVASSKAAMVPAVRPTPAASVVKAPEPMSNGVFDSDRRIEAKRAEMQAADARFMAGSNDGLRVKNPGEFKTLQPDGTLGGPVVRKTAGVPSRLPFARRG